MSERRSRITGDDGELRVEAFTPEQHLTLASKGDLSANRAELQEASNVMRQRFKAVVRLWKNHETDEISGLAPEYKRVRGVNGPETVFMTNPAITDDDSGSSEYIYLGVNDKGFFKITLNQEDANAVVKSGHSIEDPFSDSTGIGSGDSNSFNFHTFLRNKKPGINYDWNIWIKNDEKSLYLRVANKSGPSMSSTFTMEPVGTQEALEIHESVNDRVNALLAKREEDGTSHVENLANKAARLREGAELVEYNFLPPENPKKKKKRVRWPFGKGS